MIKPPVSAAADGTFKIGPGDGVPAAVAGQRMLIQPWMEAITSEGEYSLMFFGGAYSHAIVKRPKAGDFRVQPHLGGTELPCAAAAGSRSARARRAGRRARPTPPMPGST